MDQLIVTVKRELRSRRDLVKEHYSLLDRACSHINAADFTNAYRHVDMVRKNLSREIDDINKMLEVLQ